MHRRTPENVARLVDQLVNKIEIAGRAVYVLGLATQIELKRGSTRLKDQLVLPILEETLEQSRE